MTSDEWDTFTAHYRIQFLKPDDPWDFVDGWMPKLIGLQLADLQPAIVEVAGDPRESARYARQHLPLLIEHAAAIRARRRDKPSSAEWSERPKRGSAWNRLMLEQGIINQREFNRREKGLSK